MKEIVKLLNSKAEEVCRHLFKSGTKRGNVYSTGNILGEPGDSLFVYLNDGRWKDSATGEGGDMLELFAARFGSKTAGLEEARKFLGIKPTTHQVKKRRKAKSAWKEPVKDWEDVDIDGDVFKYLTEVRKIPYEVIEELGIKQKDDKVVFLTRHPSTKVYCGAMYVGIKPGKDGKKVITQQERPLSVLFGQDSVKKDWKDGKSYLIITEGQLDCASYRAQGFKNSVSIPYGAGDDNWVENSYELLSDYNLIYLSFDADQAGENYREKIAGRIGFEKCRVVSLPDNFKDANEAHQGGYDLRKAVDEAKDIKPDKLVCATDLFSETIERLSVGRREDQGIPFMGWEGEESIRFRLRPKEMTIYTGFPGHGKSNLLYQLAAYLCCKENQKVVIASLEEDAEDIYGLIMTHAIGEFLSEENRDLFFKLNKFLKNKLFFYYHRNRAPFLDVMKHGEYCIRKYGAHHFILDSVAKTDVDIEDKQQANDFIGQVTLSMNETGAHYHLVAHSRKKESETEIPTLNDIKGSNQFGIETFNCITVFKSQTKNGLLDAAKERGVDLRRPGASWRSSKGKEFDSSVLEWEDGVLAVCKQKVGGQTGRFPIWFNQDNYRFRRSYGATDEPYFEPKDSTQEETEECPF